MSGAQEQFALPNANDDSRGCRREQNPILPTALAMAAAYTLSSILTRHLTSIRDQVSSVIRIIHK